MIEINKIYDNLPVLSNILNNSEKYWAHIHTNDGKSPELLTDHINLVRYYSLQLILTHGLNNILDNLIWEIVNQNSFIKSKEEVGNFIKSLFVNSIYFHDFGKINENFQFKRMKNTSSFIFSKKNIFYSHHSKLSAYLYITHFFLKILETSYNEQEKVYLFSIVLFFSYPILKHHSSNLHKPKVTIIESEFGEIYAQAEKYIEACNFISNETIVNILKNTERVFDAYFDLSSQSEFSLFALLKLNFSIMTTSDYLATSHYMMNWEKPLTNFGVLNPKLKEDITNNIKTKLEYNRNFYKNYNYYKNYDFSNLQEKSPDNLNILRSKMAVEVIDNIRVNSEKNLFYIEAPTGGGKTNLSMIALTELMSIDIENKTNYVSKIFYIFPFTTLITQTYQSVKDTLGLDDSQVIELHSKVGFHKSKEEDKDGLFGNEKMNYIDHLQCSRRPIYCLSEEMFYTK